MIIEKLYGLLAALLFFLFTMAMADHYTCNWGGPGNDPASKGWSYVCEGEKENDDGQTADYTCYFAKSHGKAADFGKLRPNNASGGILEFASPCNSDAFAHGWCKHKAFFGLCINDGPPYSECWYQEYFDDCEFPTRFKPEQKPAKVFVFSLRYDLWEASMKRENGTVQPQVGRLEDGSQLLPRHDLNDTNAARSPSSPRRVVTELLQADAAEEVQGSATEDVQRVTEREDAVLGPSLRSHLSRHEDGELDIARVTNPLANDVGQSNLVHATKARSLWPKENSLTNIEGPHDVTEKEEGELEAPLVAMGAAGAERVGGGAAGEDGQ